MTKMEVKKRCKCAGLFLVWYWYYRRYPTTLEMFELSSDTISYLDDIIKDYENGNLIVTSYDQLDRQIDVVLSLYPVSRKMTEMVVLRGERAISSAQKKLSAIKV